MKRLFKCIFLTALAGLICVSGAANFDSVSARMLSASGTAGAPSSNGSAVTSLNPDIELSVRLDYDDIVRTGVAVPAFVTVDNQGPTLEGMLRVSVTPRRSDQASTYELPIRIEQGVKADYTLPFRITETSDLIKVQLVQRDRVTAEADRSRVKIQTTDKMLIGVFGDSRQGLNYWHAVDTLQDVYYNNVKVTAVELEASDFPEEFYLLDRFALIIFHHFDLSYLNESQVNALIQWVEQGGCLLIDADETNRQAVQSLQPLIDLRVSGAQQESDIEDLLIAAAGGVDNWHLQNLGQVEPAGMIMKGTAARPLVMAYPVQNGRVYVATFALNEISSDEREIVNMFQSVPGLSAWSGTTEYLYPVSHSSYADATMTRAVKSISWLDAPHIALVVVILAVFIILAGPVGYVILKKRDRRDWLWFTAPALSLVFCAVIAIYGAVGHGTQAVSSVVTIVDQRAKSAVQSFSLVGIGAPRQGRYELAFEEDIFPWYPAESSYYYSYYSADEQEAGRPVVQMNMNGYPRVTFEQIRQWSMDTVYLRRNIDLKGELQARVWYEVDDVCFSITNGTGIPLEDVTIVTEDGYQRIPWLRNGEEYTGALNPFDYSSYYYYYESYFLGEIYNNSGTSGSEEERENYLKAQMTSLFAGYMMNAYLDDGPLVWAWSQEAGALSISANGKPVRNDLNQTMIIGTAEFTYGDGATLYIPSGRIHGTIVDAQGTYASYYLGEQMVEFDEGEVTFAFSLPAVVKEYQLEEFYVTAEEEMGEYTALLYSNRTGNWDRYDLYNRLAGNSVQDYIHDNGRVLLRVVCGDPDDADVAGDYVFLYNLSIGLSGKETADA